MAYLLQQMLTESACAFPQNEAIRHQGQALTYAELDGVTNQVARALRRAGVERGDRVGIYVNKSPASVISIFGILKAGGVYVPLDPNSPVKRLAYIVRNCEIKVLLAGPEQLERIAKIASDETPLHCVLLTGDQPDASLPAGFRLVGWGNVLEEDSSMLPSTATIETDLAYILYTSGSTGDPKGVMISHRTILTFINWCHQTFVVNEHDRVTSHAPIHFDLSTFDIFVTIKAGGSVVLVPEKLSIFPIKLVKLLQEERITITYLVPSILSLMVNYGKLGAHDLSALRLILFAGEVFPIKFLRQLVHAVPDAAYYNLYGPTETNVCTYYRVRPEDVAPQRSQPVPIGKACENMEVFAVDEEGRRVSEVGKEGELWVRGSCVAQGYWGDRERTARSFIPNPFQLQFDEITYRTGDIVVLDEDGENWLFVGRRDHMIKTRGYRVELGEIESALYDHKGVKEAAVVAIPDDLIGNRLIAFVVPHDDSIVTAGDIKMHCIHRLPSYMAPESVEFLKMIPKTSTGKIDRPLLVQSSLQPVSKEKV